MVENSGAEQRREGLLEFYSEELSRAYDDARRRMEDPVLLLVDKDDSLGKILCEQYELKDDINILPMPLTEALELLEGHSPLVQTRGTGAAVELLASAGKDAVRVIVVAFEGATLRCVPL